MTRQDELKSIFEGVDSSTKTTIGPLITEAIFLEERLEELRKLPFIKVHPEQPSLQKVTPAAKQYRELLQQYTNVIKVVSRITIGGDDKQESPLRQWINQRLGGKNAN